MNKTSIITGACTVLLACCSCNNDLVTYEKNDLKISLEKGESWFLRGTVKLRLSFG